VAWSDRRRPTRGRLPLAACAVAEVSADRVPGIVDPTDYDGFHLVRAALDRIDVWSWDGVAPAYRSLAPGDHIVVNLGPDRDEDPLVPHFRPILAATAAPSLDVTAVRTEAVWDGWVDLLRRDGLDPADPRGLIIEHEVGEHRYGSTSASLVALGRDGRCRYDFTGTPMTPEWYPVDLG
jgi:hypothetical protein